MATTTKEKETPDEIVDRDVVGQYTGQVKWFNDRLGYGFCTICAGDLKGTDIFVHHSGIRPMNSNYKTLRKGEYVNFNLVNGHNGPQAIDVTGICGGSLMCDVLPVRRTFLASAPLATSPSPSPAGTATKKVVPAGGGDETVATP